MSDETAAHDPEGLTRLVEEAVAQIAAGGSAVLVVGYDRPSLYGTLNLKGVDVTGITFDAHALPYLEPLCRSTLLASPEAPLPIRTTSTFDVVVLRVPDGGDLPHMLAAVSPHVVDDGVVILDDRRSTLATDDDGSVEGFRSIVTLGSDDGGQVPRVRIIQQERSRCIATPLLRSVVLGMEVLLSGSNPAARPWSTVVGTTGEQVLLDRRIGELGEKLRWLDVQLQTSSILATARELQAAGRPSPARRVVGGVRSTLGRIRRALRRTLGGQGR